MWVLMVVTFPEMQIQEQENVWEKAVNLLCIMGPWKCLVFLVARWNSGGRSE